MLDNIIESFGLFVFLIILIVLIVVALIVFYISWILGGYIISFLNINGILSFIINIFLMFFISGCIWGAYHKLTS